MSLPIPRTAAVVLAGGLATRLGGGDKPLRTIAGRPMLDHIVSLLRPQVDAVAINANGNPSRFAGYGLPVIADRAVPGQDAQAGPLSGILAAMRWAASIGAGKVLTVAGDTPFFPRDLAAHLQQVAGERACVAVATSGGRTHPVFALWPVGLEGALTCFLDQSRTYSVMAFLREHETVSVDFPVTSAGGAALDPFFNVNTPDDLRIAETVARLTS